MIIADTSYIVALAINSDDNHEAAKREHLKHPSIIVPQSTLAEVMYWLDKKRGKPTVIRFLQGLSRSRYVIEPLIAQDFTDTAQLLSQYIDTRLDFVDASLIVAAQRLNIASILTFDRRDFGMVRPRHVQYFILLP